MRVAGYLGLLNGLYVAASAWAWERFVAMGGAAAIGGSAITIGPAGIAIVGLAAWSGFALDRVKLAPRSRDPADAAANPRRTRWLDEHDRLARAVMWLAGLASVALALVVEPLAALLAPAAWAAVLVYAPRPKTSPAVRRPKDSWVIKNALVATAITLAGPTAAAITVGVQPIADDLLPALSRGLWIGPTLWLWLAVFAGAVACDIDDAPGDASVGVRTVPAVFGERWGWRVAHTSAALATLVLLAWSAAHFAGGGLLNPGLTLAAFAPVLSIWAAERSPASVRRDVADASWPMLLVAAMVILAW